MSDLSEGNLCLHREKELDSKCEIEKVILESLSFIFEGRVEEGGKDLSYLPDIHWTLSLEDIVEKDGKRKFLLLKENPDINRKSIIVGLPFIIKHPAEFHYHFSVGIEEHTTDKIGFLIPVNQK